MSPFKTSIQWALVWACALTGCAQSAEIAQVSTATLTATAVSTNLPAAVTPQPVSDEPTTLVIWIPETLLPVSDEALNAVLEAEINEFVTVEDNTHIEVRRKSAQDIGGIMSTLRSASSVAPGALPDITLMRREDVLEAVDNGLIYPLEGRIASSVIADLFPAALRLGRTGDQLYALPYLLDLYLYAFRTDGETPVRWTFDTLIERGQNIAIPAARSDGMADVLWLQYTAAGGALPVDGVLELTPDAVGDVLRAYERLTEAQLLATGTADFAFPADYLKPLASGRIDSAIVTTGDLRFLTEADPPLLYSSVPTSDGQPVTLVDGWMWVIVTPNPERQALAGRFLNWMMDAGRHSDYAQAILMPPTQRTALRHWHVDGIDNALLITMLNESMPLQPEAGASGTARAFQTAWLDVISGRLSAADATSAALER